MGKDEMIRLMAELMAGLQVPVSLDMPLGCADKPWRELHRGLVSFGWTKPEQYEEAIRRVLESDRTASAATD